MSKIEQAIELFNNKKYKEALPILKALAQNREVTNENATIYNYLGCCYLELGKFDKALNEFDQGWRYFKSKIFVDNLLITSEIYRQGLHNKEQSFYKPVHYLNQYVMSMHNKYKRAEVYNLLGLFADLNPFNEKGTLKYFEKALAIEPEVESYQKNIKYINSKIAKSIFGTAYIIPKHVLSILNKLKKNCQVITKDLTKEIETNDDDLSHVFSINNYEGINIPKEIKRLEIYFDDLNYEPSYKILNDCGIDIEKNILVENSYNLPDIEVLEKTHPEEYNILSIYFNDLQSVTYKKSDDKTLEIPPKAYYQLVKKYLGHDLYLTFIGGNINPHYTQLDNYENLNFLMQYQTDWGNGEIFFVFNTKKDPMNIKIIVRH